MHDFTKDELSMIYLLALQNVNEFRQNSDCIELLSKTRKIIDNYCEPRHNDSVFYENATMLSDKHIDQWAAYLIEEFVNWKQLEKILHEFPEFEKIFIAMYKKGFQDCKNNN